MVNFEHALAKCIENSLKDEILKVYRFYLLSLSIDNSKPTYSDIRRPSKHLIDEITNEIKRLEFGFEIIP